jgi:hypothetical protein
MLQTYISIVSCVSDVCFQMYHLNVSKVDLGVAHVAVATHACFKCFSCFGLMLQMFYLDVSKVDQVLQVVIRLLLLLRRRRGSCARA